VLETGGGLLAVLVLVLLNGFFVSAEFALVTVRRTRVQQLVTEGRPGAGNVDDAVRHLDSYIAACQLGITIASLALGWVGEPALAGLLDPIFGAVGAHTLGVGVAFALITTLHVVAGELAPKGVALQYPEQVAIVIAGPLRFFRAVFRPAIWALNEAGWLLARPLRVDRNATPHGHFGADELRLVVQASGDAGALDEQQQFMLQRVIRFADLSVESVMTPRPEVIAITADTTTEEAIAFAKLHLLFADPDAALLLLLRDPLAVPAQINVQELLRLMRVRRTQIAIVVDEYGGTDGIVTLENVLEEIVGELQDEFEVPEEIVVSRPGGVVRIDAAESVDVLVELLGLQVEPGPYNTVAGLLLELLGEIPEVGVTVDVDGHRFTVVEMDELRIAAVEVRRLSPGAAPAANSAS